MTTRCTIPHKAGMSLAGLLDLPERTQFPLVILLHGFTGWKEEEHLASLAQELCARGIGALRYDALGSEESDGTLADDYRMSNDLASVESAMSFIQSELPVVGEPIGIWGHSMGGFVAIASACGLGKFAAVCGSQSSLGKWLLDDDSVEAWRATGWATFPDEHRSTTLDLPFAFYLDRKQYDIFDVIGDLKAPLLLISGTFDDIAPASQVKSIYEAAPEPKTYREFPVGHFYKFDTTQLAQINATTVDFFAGHLLSD